MWRTRAECALDGHDVAVGCDQARGVVPEVVERKSGDLGFRDGRAPAIAHSFLVRRVVACPDEEPPVPASVVGGNDQVHRV